MTRWLLPLALASCAFAQQPSYQASGGNPPGGTSLQIQFNNSGSFGGFTPSGDCTINTGTGVVTCTKINGSTPGGTCTNQFVRSINGSAVPTCATVTGTDITSSVALAGSPTTTTQAAGDNTTNVATTAFVQTAAAGINPAVAVQAATTAAADTSSFVYNNGVAGIGATLTGPTNNTAITIDGFTFTALGQRLLVKNDTQSPSGAFNGVYYVTQLQALALKPILTRALDFDQPSDINNTGFIPVQGGTANSGSAYSVSSTVNTVGTDPITFTKLSSGTSVPLGVTTQPWWPPSSANAMDDEFTGSTFNAGSLWTFVNQGSMTATQTNNSLMTMATPTQSSAQSLHMIVQTLPSAPYTFVTTVNTNVIGISGSSEYMGDMVLRESSSGKIITFGIDHASAFPLAIRVVGWSSATVDTTSIFTSGSFFQAQSFVWLRINRTSTTLTFSTSFDGSNWTSVATRTITQDFTTAPDQIGLGQSAFNEALSTSFDFFRRTL